VAAILVQTDGALGVSETLFLALVPGISAAPVAHMALGYIAAEAPDRAGRVQAMLEEVGTSVLGASAAAILSCGVLFLGTNAIFSDYAILMGAAIVGSLASSLLLFASLCAAVGPQGSQGELFFFGGGAKKMAEVHPAPGSLAPTASERVLLDKLVDPDAVSEQQGKGGAGGGEPAEEEEGEEQAMTARTAEENSVVAIEPGETGEDGAGEGGADDGGTSDSDSSDSDSSSSMGSQTSEAEAEAEAAPAPVEADIAVEDVAEQDAAPPAYDGPPSTAEGAEAEAEGEPSTEPTPRAPEEAEEEERAPEPEAAAEAEQPPAEEGQQPPAEEEPAPAPAEEGETEPPPASADA